MTDSVQGSAGIRGYYLCTFGVNEERHLQSGVEAKISAQIKAMEAAGLSCRFLECPAPSRARRGLGSLPLVSDGISWPNPQTLGNVDYLYIRRPLYSSREFLCFLDEMRQSNPGIRIVIEIPTFPYDEELSSPVTFFALRKERKYRGRWKRVVDRVADFSQQEEIFGIPTLPIRNGVDMEAVLPRHPRGMEDGTVEGVFAASFGPWHGADLLIEGLARYYEAGGTRCIVVHLAGGGSLVEGLSSHAANRGLKRHVKVHGALSRRELDELYDRCSIAFDSLALHRRGESCMLSSSLKSREYLAKGIPSVYAGTIDLFQEDEPDFVFGLPSAEKPLDFQAVLDFHDRLYAAEPEESLIRRIRRYGEEKASMDVAMKPVVDYLKGAWDD